MIFLIFRIPNWVKNDTLHLHMKDRQSEVLALRLAQEAGLVPRRGFSAPPLPQNFYEMRAAQMKGVLAKFPAQDIGRSVKTADILGLHGAFKKGILGIPVRHQVQENRSRGPADLLPVADPIEDFPQEAGYLQGMGRGTDELRLFPPEAEIVFFQEENDLPRGKGITPCLQAGRLDVSQELCKEIFRVVRGGREGLGLADGSIDALLFQRYGINRFPPELPPDLLTRLGEALQDNPLREFREFQGGADPHLPEVVGRGGTDPPDRLHGEIPEIPGNLSPWDHGEAVGLPVLGGNFRQDLRDA